MNETFQQRLARQMAEAHPGCAVRIGNVTHAATGEKEKGSDA